MPRIVSRTMRRDVGVRLGGHLAGDVDLAGRDQGLDRDPAARVLRQQRVEDAVADLVSDLVRVALRDRLGGEQAACHGAPTGCSNDVLPRQCSQPPAWHHCSVTVCSPSSGRSGQAASRPRSQTASARSSLGCSGQAGRSIRRRPARWPCCRRSRRPCPAPTSLTTIRSAFLRTSLAAGVGQRVVRSRRRRRPAPGRAACAAPSSAAMSGLVTSSIVGAVPSSRLLDLLGGVRRRAEVGGRGGHHHDVGARRPPPASPCAAPRWCRRGPGRRRPGRAARRWPRSA